METHFGKAMVSCIDGMVTITNECSECGRTVIGPIHPLHLAALATMLTTMAETLGVDNNAVQEVIKTIDANTTADRNAAAQEFEEMPLDNRERVRTTAWGGSNRKEIKH